uniref:Uncharacterized protein n=1 Tax=Anguilla anguilla TaxID=7936 RepID=A0A0E9R7R5_ANGAN
MLSFQDLRDKYVLPSSSFFMYLRIHLALHVTGIYLQSPPPEHPLNTFFNSTPPNRGFVAFIYNF